MKKTNLKFSIIFGAFIIAATTALSPILTSSQVTAADANNFKPGRIIDDAVFYNSASMTTTQIQNFLNARVPNCDTNGSGTASEFGSSLTRAQYAASRGWHAPPYTCLKDYRQNTPQMAAASGLCESVSARTNATSAQIIKDVSQACNINPQVLIVLLEKEQSLVTDIWPLQTQYRNATGFACPDTAPCDPDFEGFFYQVYYAARQFQIYKSFPDNYNYIAGQTNRIYWHPDLTRCGSSNVLIENQATAALYIYTPYRPNQAALNNLYGTGDSCSSYGNRNFWRIFTDWFGSTLMPTANFSGITFSSTPYAGESTTAQFTIRNNSNQTISLGRLKVEARSATDTQYDFPSAENVTIAPRATYTYSQTRVLPEEGQYSIFLARNFNNSWLSPPLNDLGVTSDTIVQRTLSREPKVSESLELSTDSVHAGESIAATFKIHNPSESTAVDIGRMKVEGRHSDGTQYDFGSTPDNLVIQPGATYTYSQSRSLPKTGSYTLKLMNFRAVERWSANFPRNIDSSISRDVNIQVKQSVTVTEGLELSSSSSYKGDDVTATFQLQNFSDSPVSVGRMKVEGRLSDGTQVDFDSTANNLTLAPGATYDYSSTRALPSIGTFNFKLMNFRTQERWSASFPQNESGTINRSVSHQSNPAVVVTDGLSLSKSSIHQNEDVEASFAILNRGSTAVDIGRMKVEGRHSDGTQYDFGSTPDNLVIQPGATYTYSQSRSLPKTGSYTLKLMNFRAVERWSANFPRNIDSSISRDVNIQVKQSVTVTEGLELSSSTVAVGQDVSATFELRNYTSSQVGIGRMKVEGRHSDGTQYDFGSTDDNLTLEPGQTYSYNSSRAFPRTGNYTLKLMNFRAVERWSANFPQSESTSIIRDLSLTVQ